MSGQNLGFVSVAVVRGASSAGRLSLRVLERREIRGRSARAGGRRADSMRCLARSRRRLFVRAAAATAVCRRRRLLLA